jgi:hypothetical protein
MTNTVSGTLFHGNMEMGIREKTAEAVTEVFEPLFEEFGHHNSCHQGWASNIFNDMLVSIWVKSFFVKLYAYKPWRALRARRCMTETSCAQLPTIMRTPWKPSSSSKHHIAIR